MSLETSQKVIYDKARITILPAESNKTGKKVAALPRSSTSISSRDRPGKSSPFNFGVYSKNRK